MKFSRLIIKNGIVSFQEDIEKDEEIEENNKQQNGDSQSSEEQQENGQEEQQGDEQKGESQEGKSGKQEGKSEQQNSSKQEEGNGEKSSNSQGGEEQQGDEQKEEPQEGKSGKQEGKSEQQNSSNHEEGNGEQSSDSQNSEEQQENGQEGEPQEGKSEKQEGKSEQQDSSKQEEGNEEQSSDSQSDNNQQKNDPKKAFREMLKYDTHKNENTSTGGGMSLVKDEDFDDKKIPDSVINVLIEKFLNKTFISKETDLNARRESLVLTVGDIKWNISDLIRHKTTKQYNQMLHDKYGYTKENGEDEKIPLSFYFDLSGSMIEYSRQLALISLKLLKKGVKVLIGVNEDIEYQINSISDNFSVEDLAEFFESGEIRNNKHKNQTIDAQKFEDFKALDKYLIEKEAKKVAIFSDFDPKEAIENLSNHSEIYWFCLEDRKGYKNTSLQKFKGHFYSMQNMKNFIEHLKNIDNRYYEIMQRRKWEGEER